MKFADIDVQAILEALTARVLKRQYELVDFYVPSSKEQAWREEAAGVDSATLKSSIVSYVSTGVAIIYCKARYGYTVRGGNFVLQLDNNERSALVKQLREIPRGDQRPAHDKLGPILRR